MDNAPSKELIAMLNRALEMEHQAYVQYLSHAELIEGPDSEPIEARLREIASDEEKHQKMLRNLIGKVLGGVPSMGIAKTSEGRDVRQILQANLGGEKEAVDFYSKILEKARSEKDNLPYAFTKVEHDVRHILIDEQEHMAELKQLLGKG